MRDNSKLAVVVTLKEYRLLLSATLLCQPYEGFVKRAGFEGGRYRLEFTVKQLKSFVRYLDFEKAWFDYGPRRRLLNVMIARLRGLLQLIPLMKKYTSLTS